MCETMRSIELPYELDTVPTDVLQGYLCKVMRQVLQALCPQVRVTQESLGHQLNLLLSSRRVQSNPFCASAAPGQGPALSATSSQAALPRIQLQFQHDCLRFTCSSRGAYCSLCERNTERRCEPSNNFAPKQVENKPLTTSCGAPIRVCLVDEQGTYPGLPSILPTDRICFEFSVLSGPLHDSWLHQAPKGITQLNSRDVEACEVLKSRKGPKKALLVGGWMSVQTKGLRVRLRPCKQGTAGVELCISENSEARLGKDMQYKLFVRAVDEDTGQELAQTVSQGFAVTTSRSKCNFKPAIVCLEDPLIKLDGMGAKTMTRLQQVRQCIQKHDPEGTVPEVALEKVDTVRQFKELAEQLRGHCPKPLARALLPEAAVEHAQTAVEPDDRMRRWRPSAHSQFELLYRCNQAQVRWSTPAALVDYGTKQVFLEGHISKQHEAKMASLAGEAFHCWKQEGHPGWILDDRDSSILDEMQHREMQRHLHEGMGNCTPTPSGQRHIISGHTNHSEQSLVDMQGAQGSVQGLDRRALGRTAPLDHISAGQPLSRYNSQPNMLHGHGMLDRQCSVTDGLHGWSWQQLRRSLSQPQGVLPSAKAADALAMGLEQQTSSQVLLGRLLEPEAGTTTQQQADPPPQQTEAAEHASQDMGEVTKEPEGTEQVAATVADSKPELAEATTTAACTDSIPLAEQLQMPLSPKSASDSHQGTQKSPPSPSSPSAQSCPSSPAKLSDAAASTPEATPDGSESIKDVYDQDLSKLDDAPDQAAPATPESSPLALQGTPSSCTATNSSNQEQCSSPVLMHDLHGSQQQSPEALALSQAFGLMPEHDPHDADMLGLHEIPSAASSGLSNLSSGGLTGTGHTQTSPKLLAACSGLQNTASCPMSMGFLRSSPQESSGISTHHLGMGSTGLPLNALRTSHSRSSSHAQTISNARMGAEMLGLLANTHRQSVMPHSSRPFATDFDRQQSMPGKRPAHCGPASHEPLQGNVLRGAMQHGLDRQPGCVNLSSALLTWHAASSWNAFEQQELLSRAHSVSAAHSSGLHGATSNGCDKQLSSSPTSSPLEPALKRQKSMPGGDAWGLHSPVQGTKQDPSHVPSQTCTRQLLFPELDPHGSHVHGTAPGTTGLITQDSSTGFRNWLSMAIPPAVIQPEEAASQDA